MDLNYLCMGCMEDKGFKGVCPFCGFVEGSGPVSPMHLAPRTVISEKYLIGLALGQGGFGITYLAWDIYLDRKLAVKEYFPRELSYRKTGSSIVSLHSGDLTKQYDYGLEKFLAEAKTLAIFENHPNIVTVRDFFKGNDSAYLVMNYLDGMTFCDYLSRKGEKLPFQEAVQVILPVLDALTAIHGKGLLHRDISPDNIFITVDGRVILLDFGAARHALGEKAKNLSIILKPGYAPEEQYRSRGNQGPWSDIYAAAATVYRAITGRMPPESLDRLSDDPLIRPSHLGVEINQAAEESLLKALAVKAEHRYQAVADFQNALWATLSETEGRITTGSQDNQPADGHHEEYSEQHPVSPGLSNTETQTDHLDEYYSVPQVEQHLAGAADPGLIDHGRAELKIGRSPDNDLVLNESTVSRSHARIYNQAGKWYLADLGSTHGTFIDGSMVVSDTELLAGNRIRFSQTEIYFDGKSLFTNDGKLLVSLEQLSSSGPSSIQSGPGSARAKMLQASPHHGRKIYIAAAVAALIVMVFVMVLLTNQQQEPSIAAPADSPVNNVPAADTAQDNEETAHSNEDQLQHGTISYLGGIYTGQLKNGLPHGEGTLLYDADQTSAGIIRRGERMYEGEWKNGQMHGEGTLTYPDGSKRSGQWEYDIFISR